MNPLRTCERTTSYRSLDLADVPLPPEGPWKDDGNSLTLNVKNQQWRVHKLDYSLIGYYRYCYQFNRMLWVEGWIGEEV